MPVDSSSGVAKVKTACESAVTKLTDAITNKEDIWVKEDPNIIKATLISTALGVAVTAFIKLLNAAPKADIQDNEVASLDERNVQQVMDLYLKVAGLE